jgi:hypothetical protein
MGRAESFEERLPPVGPEEEPDISHLSDELAEILYPGRRPRRFRIGIAFRSFEGPGFPRALELARCSASYRETEEAEEKVQWADFAPPEAPLLQELFELVGERPGTEVLVNGKRVPYARELWLPLVWIFVRGDA